MRRQSDEMMIGRLIYRIFIVFSFSLFHFVLLIFRLYFVCFLSTNLEINRLRMKQKVIYKLLATCVWWCAELQNTNPNDVGYGRFSTRAVAGTCVYLSDGCCCCSLFILCVCVPVLCCFDWFCSHCFELRTFKLEWRQKSEKRSIFNDNILQ